RPPVGDVRPQQHAAVHGRAAGRRVAEGRRGRWRCYRQRRRGRRHRRGPWCTRPRACDPGRPRARRRHATQPRPWLRHRGTGVGVTASGYVSPRASARSTPAPAVSFETAMLAGLAPDGGLFLPTELPAPTDAWQSAASPAAVAATVLPDLLGMDAAETFELFSRALDFAIPVVELSGSRYVLELFRGPTAAFKDVGARSMARLLDRSLSRSGAKVTVLVATSGDTGGAVADAFSGLDN